MSILGLIEKDLEEFTAAELVNIIRVLSCFEVSQNFDQKLLDNLYMSMFDILVELKYDLTYETIMVMIFSLTSSSSVSTESKSKFCVEMYGFAETLKNLPNKKSEFDDDGEFDFKSLNRWQEYERMESINNS